MAKLTISPDMKTPLKISVGFHVLIAIIAAVGIPFIAPDPINEPLSTISIEFIAPDDLTQAPDETKSKPPEPEKPTPPAAPQMTADAAPDLSQDQAPKIDEKPPEAAPETVPLPSTNAKPFPKKPKPSKPEITRQAPDQQQDNFSSLLKNLIPDADTDKPKPPEPDTPPAEETAPATNLADKLTYSEIDSVKAQLAGCWNVLSGAQYAENLIVQVKLHMNPDRTVRKATIVDKARYNRDSFYRAAADSALRALRNPSCSPLKLPADKYDEWKTTIINFDPSEML